MDRSPEDVHRGSLSEDEYRILKDADEKMKGMILMKLERCRVCGSDADVMQVTRGIYFTCKTPDCCYGPTRRTEELAAEAWNRLMKPDEDKRAVRNPTHVVEHGHQLVVVCSDGATFFLTSSCEWLPMCPIPGTEADK